MPGQLTNAKIEAVRASFVRNAPRVDSALWLYEVTMAFVQVNQETKMRTTWVYAHNTSEAHGRAFTSIGETEFDRHGGWRVWSCKRV